MGGRLAEGVVGEKEYCEGLVTTKRTLTSAGCKRRPTEISADGEKKRGPGEFIGRSSPRHLKGGKYTTIF